MIHWCYGTVLALYILKRVIFVNKKGNNYIEIPFGIICSRIQENHVVIKIWKKGDH